MVIINENIVLDFYLELIKNNKIDFLKDSGRKKDVEVIIKELKNKKDLHEKIQLAKSLWMILFEGAMLKIDNNTIGLDELFKYLNDFIDFEELLFATDSFYRDHTLHSLWTYFLMEYLSKNNEFYNISKNILYDLQISYDIKEILKEVDDKNFFFSITNNLDKISNAVLYRDSIRCIIALTHDLGYPLKRMNKIDMKMNNILNYFSTKDFIKTSFDFSSMQQLFITKMLEYMSYTFEINLEGDLESLLKNNQNIDENIFEVYKKIGEIISKIINKEEITENLKKECKYLINNTNQDNILFINTIFQTQMSMKKSLEKYMRYTIDLEKNQHGIISAYLLMRILNSFSNINLNISDSPDIPLGEEFTKMLCKIQILCAIADHTGTGYKIKSLNSFSDLLIIVDEIEEFSRISRANKYRQYVTEFCDLELSFENEYLCIDFIFSNKDIEELKPKKAFIDKCRRFLAVFDTKELSNNIKIRFRCLDRLNDKEIEYKLLISTNCFKIYEDGEEKIVTSYLNTREDPLIIDI